LSKQIIPDSLRLLVAERAQNICEYCLTPDFISSISYQIDHIISLKHGGDSTIDNLAYCCRFCNLYKGPVISSFVGDPKQLLRLYNPRTDVWSAHFKYTKDGVTHAKTLIGEGTIGILNLNDLRMVERRATFIRDGVITL